MGKSLQLLLHIEVTLAVNFIEISSRIIMFFGEFSLIIYNSFDGSENCTDRKTYTNI